jgi:hypothetical protein
MEQASDFRRNPPVGFIVWFYNALTQFRRAHEAGVMSLAVFTALVALMIASIHLDPLTAPIAILAIGAAAGAVVPKMWRDADIDALMARTAMRSIPRVMVSRAEALVSQSSGRAWRSPFLVLPPLSGQQRFSPKRS